MNALTRAGFALAIIGGLLAVTVSLADSYLLAKTLCLAAGGALIWLGLLRRTPARTSLDKPMAAFWIVMLASACFSIDRPAGVFGIYPQAFYGIIPLGLCAALYYGAAAAGSDEASTDEILFWMLAAAIALGAFGIWQGLFGDTLTGIALPTGNRITSTIGNPVMLGACLVLLCPLALDEALRKRSLIGAAALGLIAIALVMTWARGAWLSAAAGLSLYLWSTGRVRLSRRRALNLAGAALLAAFALQRGLGKGKSDALRLETAKGALTAFEEHPLLGSGPDTFLILFRRYKTDEFVRLSGTSTIGQYSAHDDLLQAAVTLGLAGFLAYAWLLWALGATLAPLLSGSARDPRGAAMAAALAGLFISAKFNPIPLSALALAAILAGLLCRRRPAASASAGLAGAASAAAFCAACALVLARFCAADHLFQRGQWSVDRNPPLTAAYMAGVNDLRRATELAPWSLDYLAKRVDVIFNVSQAASPEQGRQLIDKALDLTAAGLRLHPNHPTAHEMRATALALSSRFGSGLLPEALAEIKIASELDPTSTFTLRRRMDIDRALKDDADFQSTRARYLHVIQLTGESPGWNSPNF